MVIPTATSGARNHLPTVGPFILPLDVSPFDFVYRHHSSQVGSQLVTSASFVNGTSRPGHPALHCLSLLPPLLDASPQFRPLFPWPRDLRSSVRYVARDKATAIVPPFLYCGSSARALLRPPFPPRHFLFPPTFCTI